MQQFAQAGENDHVCAAYIKSSGVNHFSAQKSDGLKRRPSTAQTWQVYLRAAWKWRIATLVSRTVSSTF